QQDSEAEKNYREALKRDSRLANSYVGLAKVYRRQEKFQQALIVIDGASKVDPGRTDTHYLRGQVLVHLGRKEEGKKELETAIRFFIDANLFRPRLESELTNALGRQVKVGNLSLSLLSGGVTADNISIADDPAFSQSPFVQAKSLKVGVELMPLIFSKTLHVTDLTLDGPQISLVRSQNGEKWNFSSLGNKKSTQAASPTQNAATPEKPAAAKSEPGSSQSSSSVNPNLSVAKLSVND